MLAFAAPFLKRAVLRTSVPVLAGFKITNRCNLRCHHCPYWKRSGPELDLNGVIQTLDRLRHMGGRILILEGGEPLLWRADGATIEDVISAARTRFRSVCITTNGTLRWGHPDLDRVWVSLDGTREVHDSLRGTGVFDKVWANLEAEGQGRAFISTTIGTHNVDSVPDMIVQLKSRVAGVTIQFYYPYDGLPDPLFISPADRAPVLDRMMQLKRDGYPVANSFASLEDMKREYWACDDKLLANAEPDGSIFHGCYLKNRAESNCARCGFSAHNEMTLAFNGGLESVATGMKIFFSDDRRTHVND